MSDDTKRTGSQESFKTERKRRENSEAGRRADYERLADCFRTMFELEANRVTPRLDAERLTEDESGHVLWQAMDEHLRLTFNLVDWYSEAGLRLYVEMRLLADHQNIQLREAMEREGQQTPFEAEQEALEVRARAIINDAGRYTADTRRALSLALERDDAGDLAEFVRRAERGEDIWDLTDPEFQEDDSTARRGQDGSQTSGNDA